MDSEQITREWQERVGTTDEQLFTEYSERIANADPSKAKQNHRAIDERAHQFVDPTYVQRLHELVDNRSN